MKLVAGGTKRQGREGLRHAPPPPKNFQIKRSRNAFSSIFWQRMQFTQDQGNPAALQTVFQFRAQRSWEPILILVLNITTQI